MLTQEFWEDIKATEQKSRGPFFPKKLRHLCLPKSVGSFRFRVCATPKYEAVFLRGDRPPGTPRVPCGRQHGRQTWVCTGRGAVASPTTPRTALLLCPRALLVLGDRVLVTLCGGSGSGLTAWLL